MKILHNGIIRDMNAEEEAKYKRLQEETPAPSPEERLQALEEAGLERDMALMELAAMLAGGAKK